MAKYAQSRNLEEVVGNAVVGAMVTFARMQKRGCKYTDNYSSFTIVDSLIRIKISSERKTLFYSTEITMETLTRYYTLVYSDPDDNMLTEKEKTDKELGVLIKKFIDACEIMM